MNKKKLLLDRIQRKIDFYEEMIKQYPMCTGNFIIHETIDTLESIKKEIEEL